MFIGLFNAVYGTVKPWETDCDDDDNDVDDNQGGRSCETARPPVSASAGAPALAGSPSIAQDS